MRNFVLLLFAAFQNKGFSQVPMAMPPEADAFYNKAMPNIKPRLKTIIVSEAKLLKNTRPNGDSLFNVLHTSAAFKNIIDRDLHAITTLIMVQASKDADEDLKKMVIAMRNGQATPSESEDEKKLRLELISRRKSEIAEQVSLVIQGITDSREMIIENLKKVSSLSR